MAVFKFGKIGVVTSRPLPSGAISISHDFDSRLRAIVEPICRGRGDWSDAYCNWVIEPQDIDFVIAALSKAAREIR